MSEKVVIGNAELYCGDCLEIMPQLKTKIDALITDPPYGINGGSGTISKERGKGDYAGAFEDTQEYIDSIVIPAICFGLSISGRAGITPGTKALFKYPAPKDFGIFNMPSGSGLNYWGRITEQMILYYGDDPRLGKTIANKSYTINEPHEEIDHPCPKPIKAWQWLVNKVSLEGHMVLDPFMGSGTTGIACHNLGRKFIGIELEPKYFDLACKRIEKAQRQEDFFISSA